MVPWDMVTVCNVADSTLGLYLDPKEHLTNDQALCSFMTMNKAWKALLGM